MQLSQRASKAIQRGTRRWRSFKSHQTLSAAPGHGQVVDIGFQLWLKTVVCLAQTDRALAGGRRCPGLLGAPLSVSCRSNGASHVSGDDFSSSSRALVI